MDYVQLPASGFYFVLGAITGIIVFIAVVSIWAKQSEKKSKEKLNDLFTQLVAMGEEAEKKTKKNDK